MYDRSVYDPNRLTPRQARREQLRPLFPQVAREPRLSDKVAEMMLETILSGRLQVGDRLPSERELGEQFGVSRTVVREAVRALVAKGVIEVRSGSGLRVVAVNAAQVSESMSLYVRGGRLDFEQVHEVRALLEVQIAGLAAERCTDEEVARLARGPRAHEDAADDVEAAAANRSRVPPADSSRDAQRAVSAADGLDRGSLIDIRRANLGSGSTPETLAQHQAILDEIAAHRSQSAARARWRITSRAWHEWWREHVARAWAPPIA